ncbi:hypothetical protein [Calothrix sp. NIES-2098]|uniref:hypothetical protein n=1 Tax=Calothrix sp. NIES-2098 TaxID=1954171 RepID=UPI000B61A670|nr:hypothetical protein NIES2098_74170 [Calothrix sp. NIES-2098]
MEDTVQTAKNIAFEFLKLMSPAGLKAGRYIYVDYWRNQLIEYAAQRLGIEVDDMLRSSVEQELKQAWQNILYPQE